MGLGDFRYTPREFWAIIAVHAGREVIPDRTKTRWLTQAMVSRDADGCYGLAELEHIIELVVDYLGVKRTFREFRIEKGLESPSPAEQSTPKNTIKVNCEVIY